MVGRVSLIPFHSSFDVLNLMKYYLQSWRDTRRTNVDEVLAIKVLILTGE
jgi:hypothetical protein